MFSIALVESIINRCMEHRAWSIELKTLTLCPLLYALCSLFVRLAKNRIQAGDYCYYICQIPALTHRVYSLQIDKGWRPYLYSERPFRTVAHYIKSQLPFLRFDTGICLALYRLKSVRNK